VYIRRGRFRLRYKDRHEKTFDTIEETLQAWAAEYGNVKGDRLRDIILDYRANILPAKSAGTRKGYGRALDKLSAVFGDMRLSELRPVHIYKYQDIRAGQGASVLVNRELATLSVVCAHGVRLGHADINPCRQVRRRPETPRTRYVTDAELAIVYGLASEWMKRAIRMVCITGIRLGDLCRIGPENHTEDGFLYQQGKTGRKILIEWTETLREAAQRPPVSYEGFSSAWQRVIQKARQNGLKEGFTFHDLRAKAGSESRDWRLLGHKDRGTFERIYNRLPVRIVADNPDCDRAKS